MRPLARLVPTTLALLAACATADSPAGLAPDSAAVRAAPSLATDVSSAAAAPTGYVVNTALDLFDPDAGRGPSFDDHVCDDVDGLTVGNRCSLRGALQNHNVTPDVASAIGFAIGTGTPTIRLEYDLPDILGTVTIDGSAGGGGATRVELNGTDIPTDIVNLGRGLKLRGGRGSQIRNLVLNNFRGVALDIIVIGSASGENVVEDNYIGTNGAGTAAASNGWGIEISSQPFGNPVGGNVIRNNVIGGSRNFGVHVGSSGSRNNVIVGNRIGLGADGVTPVPNYAFGVLLDGPMNRVGGPQSGDANIIVATIGPEGDPSGGSGVMIRSDSNRVERNLIGVAPGPRVLPNAGQGVALLAGRANVVVGNSIVGNRRGGIRVLAADYGDPAAGPTISTNTIKDNRYFGVEISGSWAKVMSNSISGTVQADNYGGPYGGGGVVVTDGRHNAVRGNSISGNAALGIDLGRNGVTPNDPIEADSLQNYPVVSAATASTTGTTIRATLASRPSTTFTLDFYATQPCDASGYGEGLSYLGAALVTTDAAGNAAVVAQLRQAAVVGSFVTATATDPTGSTSELSACRVVTSGLPNRPPVAEAGGPYAGNEGAAIAFSSAGSGDPDSTALTYRWEFGDGTTSATANPAKAYVDNGTYKVKLTVTDPLGLTSVDSAVATIANVAPTGTFIAPPALVEGADSFTLQLVGTDAGTVDRTSLTYAFDCGLGAGFTPWGASPSVSCYDVPDRPLTVQAKVRDKDGGETLYSRSVVVTNAAPSVQLGATAFATLPVGAPFSVSGMFVDSVDTDAPWRYAIQWGDGAAATTGTGLPWESIAAAHTYTRAGVFAVQLAVTDKDGGTGWSARVTVTVYAPSAPRLVFASTRDVSTGELYLVNADGTGLTRLTNDLSPDRDPAWSPDGSQLAWVQGSGGGQLLRVMKADGTLLPGFICGGGSGPAWSRGGKVAFVYADGDIYVANPDGTGLERRTYDGMYQPYSDLAWSPVWNSPGPELAYTRGGEIYIQGRQLTAGGGRNAAWSPNGAKIAFVSDRAGNPEIYVVNYDGSGLTRLTTNAAADVEPTWSSDGTKLAFVSDRDGVRDLYVMNADGSGVTRIPVGGRASRPRWRP